MKLWGGRFTKETNELVNNFNASISFDQKFYKQDIEGSIAHATMLAAQGIISEDEGKQITDGLKGILSDIESGKLEITDEYEDIHTFMEATLIERIGDAGKKLHTGRSRNDQVALDMRLYTRDEVKNVDEEVRELMEVILRIIKENVETYMPGFTHLQKAQPVTVAHHFSAYFEMFKRDRSRLHDIYKRMNYCPLGAGALAGTTYPLNREMTASLLGFDGPTLNSMDSVSDRDYVIEFLSALSTIMMHLSRFSEEICIWNSNEYKFIELDDAFSTGSSIMPQKKNPDIAELVRGKTGRVYGALMSILTTMKGIPLAYNKDMQEDKELTFDAIDTVKGCVSLFKGMIDTMKFNDARMEDSAKKGFTNATDAADYLVKKGVPFRDAHGIVGQLVLMCIDKGIALDDLSLDEYKKISDTAKILYGILLSRLAMSKKNNWIEEDTNRVYILYNRNDIAKKMGRSPNTISNAMNQLLEVGLIKRKRQGQGKADMLYVMNFSSREHNKKIDMPCKEEKEVSVSSDQPHSFYENREEKVYTNDIDIPSPQNKRTAYREIIKKQVDYDILRQSPYDMNIIDNIVEVMVNVYASQKECINISGDMIPLNEVINRLKRINLTHIQYVMECIGKSIKSIRRPNNYLLTALYNAPVTTDLYYAMQVKHDLHNYPDG